LAKLLYISPSIFPSKAANSTHVVLQVDALARLYDKVLVVGMAERNAVEISKIPDNLRESYNVRLENVDFALCRNLFGFAENLSIALFSVRFLFFLKETKVITRNLYAALLGLFLIRGSFIYETHNVENGFRSIIQRILLRAKRVQVIVISNSLKKMLVEKYELKNNRITVCHDAARSNLPPIKDPQIEIFDGVAKYINILGYFGSLYPGRGIDIIEGMAKRMPDSLFVVFGPPGQNLEFERRVNKVHLNVRFYGFVSHKEIHRNMLECDFLLMPYQRTVSIGPSGSDTSKWMSPMKMFEYMAAARPIISSDLPVLHEVLTDKVNALLVTPDNIQKWVEAASSLRDDSSLRDRLAFNARSDYESKYNWGARASAIKVLFG
jgi:glycosyltransferase involved in cell wall biosynthesis